MANEKQDSADGQVEFIDPADVEGIDIDNLNLVGKLLTKKEISYNTIRAAIMGMWGNPQGVAISEVGKNKILISFRDHYHGMEMMKKGPWSIKGHLLNLQIWSGVESVYVVKHNLMHLWVQMHGVPLSYMNRLTAEKLGKAVGNVVDMLSIKRKRSWKRSWNAQLYIEGMENKVLSTDERQRAHKRSKEYNSVDKAEEAGHITPQSGP
ncbi:hypothetical protein PIB30_010911 [Stylosanthes scabra]|uniref:DUF4283 domain-containing protein n=1 Tax=Stylosanthes scabra TaxID=79078 RepID=A0ABU6T7Q0_9FABA|nr:hypothetical protein [Stylosanthes scabra]